MSMKTSTNPTSTSTGASHLTPSTALLNKKIGKSPSPRMLTRSEIELLRRSAYEIVQVLRDARTKDSDVSDE